MEWKLNVSQVKQKMGLIYEGWVRVNLRIIEEAIRGEEETYLCRPRIRGSGSEPTKGINLGKSQRYRLAYGLHGV